MIFFGGKIIYFYFQIYHMVVHGLMKMLRNRYIMYAIEVSKIASLLCGLLERKVFAEFAETVSRGYFYGLYKKSIWISFERIFHKFFLQNSIKIYLQNKKDELYEAAFQILSLLVGYKSDLSREHQHEILDTLVTGVTHKWPTTNDSRLRIQVSLIITIINIKKSQNYCFVENFKYP